MLHAPCFDSSVCHVFKLFSFFIIPHQLGYLVWSGLVVQSGVLGFFTTVQSDHQSADYLSQRVDACLAHVRATIMPAWTHADWDDHRASLVRTLYAFFGTYPFHLFQTNVLSKLLKFNLLPFRLEDPKTPEREAAEIWSEIDNLRFDFTRSVQDACAVESLTLPDDVIAFFDEYLAPESPSRRKLVTQVCQVHSTTISEFEKFVNQMLTHQSVHFFR